MHFFEILSRRGTVPYRRKRDNIFLLNDLIFLRKRVYSLSVTKKFEMKDKFMEDSIRILSYNLRSGRGMAGDRNINRTAEVIRSLAADVAGLQEVRIYKDLPAEQGDMPGLLAEETNMRAYFGRTLDRETFSYGIGILSACPSELMEVMMLPQPDRYEQRAVIVTKVRHGNRNFYLLNTHLVFENDAEEVRQEQLRAIIALVKEKGYVPAILTGDFNAQPDAPCLQPLREEWGMTDLTEATFPADKPEIRIDYIAWYPREVFRLLDFKVIDETVASDHRPIVAELSCAD